MENFEIIDLTIGAEADAEAPIPPCGFRCCGCVQCGDQPKKWRVRDEKTGMWTTQDPAWIDHKADAYMGAWLEAEKIAEAEPQPWSEAEWEAFGEFLRGVFNRYPIQWRNE